MTQLDRVERKIDLLMGTVATVYAYVATPEKHMTIDYRLHFKRKTKELFEEYESLDKHENNNNSSGVEDAVS